MIAYIAATVTATDVVCASDSVVEVWGGAKMKLLHSLSLQTYPTLQSLTIVALDSPNSNVPPSTSPTPIYLTTASTTTPPVLSLYTLSSSTTTHTTASSPFTLVSTPIQSFTLPHDSTSPLLHLCDSTIRFPHAPILHTPPTASTAPICAQPHLLLNNILTVTPTAAPTASDTSETSDAAAASRLSIDVHSTNHPIQTYHLLTSPNVTSVATVTTSDTFVTVTNTGVIYLLKLKPHDAIMDVLVRKHAYILATEYAVSNGLGDSRVSAINKLYGDWLYDCGERAKGMEEYIKAGEEVRMGYVIGRYLDPKDKPALLSFVEAYSTGAYISTIDSTRIDAMRSLHSLLTNGDAVQVFENVDYGMEISVLLAFDEVDTARLETLLEQLSIHDTYKCAVLCGSCVSHLSPAGLRLYLDCLTFQWRTVADRDGEASESAEALSDSVLGVLHGTHAGGGAQVDKTDALVIVQQYDFTEGVVYLLEKLKVSEVLMEEYEGMKNGKSKMLALGEGNVEDLKEGLRRIVENQGEEFDEDDGDDLQEGLEMANSNGVDTMEVMQILRDGTDVKLKYCLDYISEKLEGISQKEEELSKSIAQYQAECARLEGEIEELEVTNPDDFVVDGVNLTTFMKALEEGGEAGGAGGGVGGEEFWREVNGAGQDRFEAIAKMWGRGIIK